MKALKPQAVARIILFVMAHRLHLGSEQSAPHGAVVHNAELEGVESGEFADGLEWACEQGWLTADERSFTLTRAGYATI
jgi:hypothetical protein